MRFQAINESGRNWLAYMGRSGSGKSTQAFMAVDALLKRKKPVWAKAYYYPELVRELSAYRFDAEKYEDKLDDLLEPDLVLLDDYLDVIPKPESFEEQVALTLIKRRYLQRAPLILTTELTPPDFPKLMPRHGEAVFGRVLEMCDHRIEIYGSKSVNYRFHNATVHADGAQATNI